jgi:vancomycin aglycone glucosyltransferase
MRVLLTTFGSRGDVQPVLALAVALRALGADARVCAPPDDEFTTLFAAADVPWVPAFTAVRKYVSLMSPTGVVLSLQDVAAKIMTAQYEAISAAAKDGCDLVLATGLFPSVAASQCVAEKLGAHFAYATYSPIFLPSQYRRPFEYPNHPHLPAGETDIQVLWKKDAEVMDSLFGVTLNALRASIGLPQVNNVRDYVHTQAPILAADPVLAPWQRPATLDVEQTGAWMLPDARPLPSALLTFLDTGAPPVYVGFGSVPVSKDFAKIVIDVLRAQRQRILLSRGWAALTLEDSHEDCFVVGEINHQVLFPRVAAVIHHGGAGTTTAAAQAGCPQVVLPLIVDQPYWAGRVCNLGIGTAENVQTMTTESLSAAIHASLRKGERAREIAKTIQSDGAMRSAQMLLGKA